MNMMIDGVCESFAYFFVSPPRPPPPSFFWEMGMWIEYHFAFRPAMSYSDHGKRVEEGVAVFARVPLTRLEVCISRTKTIEREKRKGK